MAKKKKTDWKNLARYAQQREFEIKQTRRYGKRKRPKPKIKAIKLKQKIKVKKMIVCENCGNEIKEVIYNEIQHNCYWETDRFYCWRCLFDLTPDTQKPLFTVIYVSECLNNVGALLNADWQRFRKLIKLYEREE